MDTHHSHMDKVNLTLTDGYLNLLLILEVFENVQRKKIVLFQHRYVDENGDYKENN